MSLAITAAPFDSDNDTNDTNFNCNDTAINKKRQSSTHTHTKTQKKTPTTDFNSEKVMSVLQSIHNNTTDNELGDYNPKKNYSHANSNHVVLNPLEPPVLKEGMTNIASTNTSTSNSVPLPLDNDEMDLQELQSAFLYDAQVRDYYKKLIPNHRTNDTNKAYYPQRNMANSGSNNNNNNNNNNNGSNNNGNGSSNDDLLNKLNYMINLLEDQQDERTNNVTEEVVLYSFLGIFIIFVVDSFARVGKYTR